VFLMSEVPLCSDGTRREAHACFPLSRSLSLCLVISLSVLSSLSVSRHFSLLVSSSLSLARDLSLCLTHERPFGSYPRGQAVTLLKGVYRQNLTNPARNFPT